MRSNAIKNFESNIHSLKDLNKALENFDKSKIRLGKFGHAKIAVRYGEDENSLMAEFSRSELVRFARELASKEDHRTVKRSFKDFKEKYTDINNIINDKIEKSTSKRVKLGRKVASFAKHFHNPEKKIASTTRDINIRTIGTMPDMTTKKRADKAKGSDSISFEEEF